MIVALVGLIECDFVRIANTRHSVSHHLVDLSKEESLVQVRNARSLLHWLESERVWRWTKHTPRPEVVITEAGEDAALQVLSEDGWPPELG